MVNSKKLTVATILLASLGALPAYAIDEAATTAFTSLTSEIGTYAVPAFGLITSVLTLMIGIKWFKKIISRAS